MNSREEVGTRKDLGLIRDLRLCNCCLNHPKADTKARNYFYLSWILQALKKQAEVEEPLDPRIEGIQMSMRINSDLQFLNFDNGRCYTFNALPVGELTFSLKNANVKSNETQFNKSYKEKELCKLIRDIIQLARMDTLPEAQKMDPLIPAWQN